MASVSFKKRLLRRQAAGAVIRSGRNPHWNKIVHFQPRSSSDNFCWVVLDANGRVQARLQSSACYAHE